MAIGEFESTANVIRSRFNSNFPGLQPNVSILWDNFPGEPPDRGQWVRLTIQEGISFQAAYSATRLWRTPGVVIVQIFIPAGTGDGEAREIADDVSGIFRGVTDSGVLFKAPYVTRVGLSDDEVWYQLNVNIPYQVDLAA